jgi:hypothetical protein
VGTSPNPNGTLTSDDPFSGETNGIPNGLRVPTLGIWGLTLPSDPGCFFGTCGFGMIFDATNDVTAASKSCLADAAQNFALHAGVDVVGFVGALLPGGTALSVVVNGAAATSGFGVALLDLPGDPHAARNGALMTTGGLALEHAGDAAVHAGLAVGRLVPVAGAIFSGVSLVLDYQQYQKAKNACVAGGN